MDNFDKQRIENAIWTLQQYSYEIKEIALKLDYPSWDCDKLFDIIEEIKEEINK